MTTIITGRSVQRAGAAFLLCLLVHCASRRPLCDRIAGATDSGDRGIRAAIQQVLSSVATSGNVDDPCVTEAAIEVAGRLGLQENIPALRRIAVLDSTAAAPGIARQTVEDTISQAMHALLMLKDSEVTALARRHLNDSASIAGTAVSTLLAAQDWESTTAVADRLAADDDPRRHFALVWLSLEFLAQSPERPASACAALRRLHVFDSISPTQRRDPVIAKIESFRQSLALRYSCAE